MIKRILLTGLMALLVMAPASWASQVTRLYGQVVFFGETLDRAKVTITLSGASTFYTSTTTIAPGQIVLETDTAGYFGTNVYLTDSLNPAATYSIKIEHPNNQNSGITFTASGLSITTADSVSLRTVLAQ